MSLRVVVEDDRGVPVREITTYAATPLAADQNWRGPLMPGSKRRLSVGSCWARDSDLTATVEITELRIWEREVAPGIGPGSRTATASRHHPKGVEAPTAPPPSQPRGAAPATAERAPANTAADPRNGAPAAEPPRTDQSSKPPHDTD